MATTISFTNLDTKITNMRDRVETYRRYYSNDTELSPEGKQARFQNAIQSRDNELSNHAAAIRAQLEAARDTARRNATTARDKIMPAPTEETQLAAELTAQRLLGRHYESSTAAFQALTTGEPVSPGRTLAINEIMTRNKVNADYLEGHLATAYPEYREAKKTAHIIETGAAALTAKLDRVQESMGEVTASNPTRYDVSVTALYAKGMPETLDTDTIVPAIGELSALDRAYNQ